MENDNDAVRKDSGGHDCCHHRSAPKDTADKTKRGNGQGEFRMAKRLGTYNKRGHEIVLPKTHSQELNLSFFVF